MNKKQPNLLFIMSDQFRYDAMGVHGNSVIKTPNFDAFAKESVDVENYYTNCPVCVPSRVTLFTGRYPHSHRIRENHTLPETGSEMHLFRILKQEGYYLGYTGKNHLLNDNEFENFGFVELENAGGYPERDTPFHHKYSKEEIEYLQFERERSKVMEEKGAYAGAKPHKYPEEVTEPHIFTDAAIRFLNQRAEVDRPFCLCLSWMQPHAPHIAPEFLRKLYDGLELPDINIDALREKAGRYFVKYRAQRSDLATDDDRLNFIATYYAMVTALDRQLGRLLSTLKELGMEEDTIVVFTSDHGDFLFENGMCKKDLVLTDDLLHVPLIIRHKGTLAPRIAGGMGMMEEVDVLPTLLEMLNIEPPIGIQGKSAVRYLTGETDYHKDAVYGEICTPWQYNPYKTFEEMESDWQSNHGRSAPLNVPGDFTKSIRTKEYRYVWYKTGEEELYHLLSDPKECKNLASSPLYK